jgi:hypothetical protein
MTGPSDLGLHNKRKIEGLLWTSHAFLILLSHPFGIGIDDSGKISELTVPKNAPDSNYW